MKNQSDILGYMLLGIVVTAIAIGVYLWGAPLIQKSALRAQVNNMEGQLSSLADSIEQVGFNGGEKYITISGNQMSSGTLTGSEIFVDINYGSQYYAKLPYPIPINYNGYYPCNQSNIILIPSSGYNSTDLCGYPGLYAYVNSTDFIIYDPIVGENFTFSNQNYQYLITSIYTFKVLYNGNSITFIPLYNSGIYGYSEYPACIVDGVTVGTTVDYTVQCRPLYDLSSEVCHWIQMQVLGSSTSNSITYNIVYKGSSLSTNVYSTVCNEVKYYYLDVYIS